VKYWLWVRARVHRHVGGGEVIRDLILRESEECRGARDVELGAFYFFGSKRILAGTDGWTPYFCHHL
jgi:hypothetical protein